MYTKYTGIILKKHPIGEADELLTIYTKEAGKLRVRAVASRKISSRLAGNPPRLNAIAFEVAGTLYRLTPDRQENSEAYEAVANFLHLLGESREEKIMARSLQLNLLRLSGFLMPLSVCLNCSRELLPEERGVYFVGDKGGMFCEDCLGETLSQVRVERETLEELRLLNSPERPKTLHWPAEQVIDGFLHYILEREIKSKNFLSGLTGEND